MQITQHTVIKTKTETFSRILLANYEVTEAVGGATNTYEALQAATRAGSFAPVTAGPEDTVAIDLKSDGSADIVVVATTVVVTLPDAISVGT